MFLLIRSKLLFYFAVERNILGALLELIIFILEIHVWYKNGGEEGDAFKTSLKGYFMSLRCLQVSL